MNTTIETPNAKTVNTAVIASVGAIAGVAAFAAGVKFGFSTKTLVQDLTAHQLVLTAIREADPTLVDETVKNVMHNLEAIIGAAN